MTRIIRITALIVSMAISGSFAANAQSVEDEYNRLMLEWLEISDGLKSYVGLSAFCQEPAIRNYTVDILSMIHKYDSVVLDFLNEPASVAMIGESEHRRALKEINKFEERYSVQSFLGFLREGCKTRNAIERDKEDLKMMMGAASYDGQILVLETDLVRFLKHLDRRVVSIDKHIHRIHPDRFVFERQVDISKAD